MDTRTQEEIEADELHDALNFAKTNIPAFQSTLDQHSVALKKLEQQNRRLLYLSLALGGGMLVGGGYLWYSQRQTKTKASDIKKEG